MKYLFAILLALIGVGPVLAQATPTFKIVAGADPAKGHIMINDLMYQKTQRIEKRQVQKDGKVILVDVTVEMLVPTMYTFVMDVAKGRVITPDGKQLPIDEVWNRLKEKTVVVVSGDSNTPDQSYLRALNPETIVIIPAPLKK